MHEKQSFAISNTYANVKRVFNFGNQKVGLGEFYDLDQSFKHRETLAESIH